MRKHALLISIGALALIRSLSGQQASQAPVSDQPPVVFKLEVNYVEVDALVVDDQGNFVRDLKKDDFKILEDGKPQEVSLYSLVDIPVERADRPLFAAQPIEPDVQTNSEPFQGRIYLIVLDDLQTDALRSALVKAAARRFVERYLGANDLAAVVHISGRSDAAQDFTSSRRLLLSAIDKFMGQKLRSATLEKMDAYQRNMDLRQGGAKLNDPLDSERGFQARSTIQSLKNLADAMAGVRGRRKALLYISEGIDYDIHDYFNSRYALTLLDDVRDTISAATRSNVNIYGIDPRGLTNLGDLAVEMAGLPDDPNQLIGFPSLQDELRISQDSLRVLSDETGGFAVVNTNDFPDAFERVVRENSSYYVLGYYPTNDKRDGKFRKIEVQVNRPGVKVRARKGYVAPRGKPTTKEADAAKGSPEVKEALNSPLQSSGLTLRVNATAFKGPAPNASIAIAVEADGRAFKFAEKEGKFEDVLELSVVAIDSKGKIQGVDHSALTMGLKPETRARLLQTGFRIVSKIDVPPGRYQLRVAAREVGGGTLGSVFYDLDVPDFGKQPFSMSGVVLASAERNQVPTARVDQLKDFLPAVPTTAREFRTSDELAVFAEVYDNEVKTPHQVDIVSSVLTDDGRVVFKNAEQRASSELGGSRGGFGYATRVPLKDLAPGSYVLKVEATSRLGNPQTATRQIQFRVQS